MLKGSFSSDIDVSLTSSRSSPLNPSLFFTYKPSHVGLKGKNKPKFFSCFSFQDKIQLPQPILTSDCSMRKIRSLWIHRFQIFFSIESRFASRSSRDNCLSVAAVLHISRREDPFNACFRLIMSNNISIFI